MGARTLQVSYESGSVGDWIGLVRGEGIVTVSGTPDGAAIGLLRTIVTEDREIGGQRSISRR